MRRMVLYGIAVMMLLSVVVSADLVSEDYQEGYQAACDTYGRMQYMGGLIDAERMILEVLEENFGTSMISSLAGTYNDQVTAFNDLVNDVNEVTLIVLGESASEHLLEYRQYYH